VVIREENGLLKYMQQVRRTRNAIYSTCSRSFPLRKSVKLAVLIILKVLNTIMNFQFP